MLSLSSALSAQGIERRPEIAFVTTRRRFTAEWIETGAELHHLRDKLGERLPERSEKFSFSGSLGSPLFSGERREGEED